MWAALRDRSGAEKQTREATASDLFTESGKGGDVRVLSAIHVPGLRGFHPQKKNREHFFSGASQNCGVEVRATDGERRGLDSRAPPALNCGHTSLPARPLLGEKKIVRFFYGPHPGWRIETGRAHCWAITSQTAARARLEASATWADRHGDRAPEDRPPAMARLHDLHFVPNTDARRGPSKAKSWGDGTLVARKGVQSLTAPFGSVPFVHVPHGRAPGPNACRRRRFCPPRRRGGALQMDLGGAA